MIFELFSPFLRCIQTFRKDSSYFRYLGSAVHLSSQDQQQKQTEGFLGDATLLLPIYYRDTGLASKAM